MLDSGEAFRVHSCLLELSSATVAEAVAAGVPASTKPISLCLPGVSSKQALLLLDALYCMPAANTWANTQGSDSLRELATIGFALACPAVVTIADDALVRQASSCISPTNVINLYRQARELGMQAFQNKCAEAIITMLRTLEVGNFPATDDGLLPILQAAQAKIKMEKVAW